MDRWLLGDTRQRLNDIEPGTVHTCVTSPPYYGLRDYGVAGQIGLEPTPDEYVRELVGVFRGVRRALRDDGTLWLNLGDSYASTSSYNTSNTLHTDAGWKQDASKRPNAGIPDGMKAKDLIGIPWAVAFALRADGWYLRQDIVWSKPSCMPESVADRCTKSHEYVFLLSKSARYYFDQDAIREPHLTPPDRRASKAGASAMRGQASIRPRGNFELDADPEGRYYADGGRNKRSVWTVATRPFAEAHFATMPPELAEPCVLAGSPVGGMVLDPFGGAGTTALVARRLGRRFTHIELNPDYMEIAQRRLGDVRFQSSLFGGGS